MPQCTCPTNDLLKVKLAAIEAQMINDSDEPISPRLVSQSLRKFADLVDGFHSEVPKELLQAVADFGWLFNKTIRTDRDRTADVGNSDV